MKRTQTAKTILTLLMSMVFILTSMSGALAFEEGDVIADIEGMEKEFGTPLMSVTADGKTAGDITATSSSTDFYNYMEEKNTDNSSAAYVTDAVLEKTVVELKSDKLASYNVDMPFANTTGTITKSSTVYNQAYLGIAGASTEVNKDDTRYDANENLEQEYVFSVMFRAPKAANVSTWLFCGTNNQTSLNHATLVNGTKFGRGIEITNGNVYVYNNGEGFSTDDGAAINTETLNADEWYRAIRVMKFPKNTKAQEKVVILKKGVGGEYDTVVAQSSEWTTAENFSSSGDRFAHMFFIGEYPANYSGSKVAITDFDTYQVDYTEPQANVDLDTQRVLQFDATGTGTEHYANATSFKFIAERLSGKNGRSQSAYITFRLPDVGEDSVSKFFRLNIGNKYAGVAANATNAAQAPYSDSYAMEIKGDTLYANIYSASSTLDTGSGARSFTNLVKVDDTNYYTQKEIYTGIEADKWYTLELKRSDMSSAAGSNTINLYVGTVNRNDSLAITKIPVATWTADAEATYVLPYLTNTTTLSGTHTSLTISGYSIMTFLAATNYTGKIDINALDMRVWEQADFTGNNHPAITFGVDDNWEYGFATKSGTDKTSPIALGEAWNCFRYQADDTPNSVESGNDVADDDFCNGSAVVTNAVADASSDFIATGTTASRVVNDIIIKYNAPISFNASDFELTYGSGQPVSINPVYDEAANTVTVEVNEKLRYGTDYTLTVNATQTSQMGFDVDGQVWTFTCEDWFTASNLSIVDDEGTPVSSLAVNTPVKANATFTNDSLETRTYVLILAVYKGNQMVGAKALSGTIDSGVTLTNIQTEAFTITEEGCKAKAMLWDSFETIEPKIAPAKFPLE